MDWAFFFGSSAGTFEAYRCVLGIESMGRTQAEKVGRRRRVPVRSSVLEICIDNIKTWNSRIAALVNREVMMTENTKRRSNGQSVS